MTAIVFSSLRILLVEDDQFIRSTLKRLLVSLGTYNVEEASDGMVALQMVAAVSPHLISCDIHMAPMDGPAFVLALRASADPKQASCPVIMLTADSSLETVQELSNLGISGYLLKPVTRALLGQRISTAMQRAA